MIKNITKYLLILLAVVTFSMTSCGDDDNNETGNKIQYTLEERDNSSIDGDIEFVELESGKVQIEIDLSGTQSGNTHPAHIHMNSAAFGGEIIVSLDPVDGATGSSVTIVDKTDAGDLLTFDMISNLDAYVNVHKSDADLATLIAQGDIGSNELTGDVKSYVLNEREIEGINGQILFKKRKNGFTLTEIVLDGTPTGGLHPAHIHMNSALEGGDILISLTTVDGTTGSSLTDVRTTDDGATIDYEDILTSNAYVNVHLSATELTTIVAQGDIGTNELTGESISYNLDEKDVEGISGNVTFEERTDGSIKATIELDGTPENGMHPAHIHENSALEGGPILVTFNPVNGSTGLSQTTLRQFDDGSGLNYQALKTLNGYVNVHLSMADLGTIVSQGDIGINN